MSFDLTHLGTAKICAKDSPSERLEVFVPNAVTGDVASAQDMCNLFWSVRYGTVQYGSPTNTRRENLISISIRDLPSFSFLNTTYTVVYWDIYQQPD